MEEVPGKVKIYINVHPESSTGHSKLESTRVTWALRSTMPWRWRVRAPQPRV